LATGVLKCHRAAQTPGKPDDPNAKGCIDKVTVRFNGGKNPDRGCFEQLEGKPNNDCGTFDDTATLEAAVNSCVLDFLSRLTSTTTTTPTSTTTTSLLTSTTTTTPTSTTTTTTAGSSTAYPLKVSGTGRYLVDQDGVPFLMIGDSPQALTVNLSEAEADAFFADRQAAGFNLVWANLLCATYTGGRPDGSTYDGIVPFTTPNDLATPNDAFFTRVDHMLTLAAEYGLVVLLDPAETGSYLSVLNANGV